MSTFVRRKRKARTYWAELGFLILGIFGLKPDLVTSLFEQQVQQHVDLSATGDWLREAYKHATHTGVSPAYSSLPQTIPGSFQQSAATNPYQYAQQPQSQNYSDSQFNSMAQNGYPLVAAQPYAAQQPWAQQQWGQQQWAPQTWAQPQWPATGAYQQQPSQNQPYTNTGFANPAQQSYRAQPQSSLNAPQNLYQQYFGQPNYSPSQTNQAYTASSGTLNNGYRPATSQPAGAVNSPGAWPQYYPANNNNPLSTGRY